MKKPIKGNGIALSKLGKLVFYFVVISLPFYSFSAIKIANRGVQYGWIFGSILVFLGVLQILYKEGTIKWNGISLAVILLNCSVLLSLTGLYGSANSGRITDFLSSWVQVLFVTSLFFVISNLRVSWNQIRRLLKAWVILAVLISGYGIYQLLAWKFGLPFQAVDLSGFSISFREIQADPYLRQFNLIRPFSVFAEPSWLGKYLTLPLLFCGICIITRRNGQLLFKSKFSNYTAFFILAIGFVLAFSLGAYVALLATGMLFFINARLSIKRKIITISLLLALTVVMLNFGLETLTGENFLYLVFERFRTLGVQVFAPQVARHGEYDFILGTSYFQRIEAMSSAIKVWITRPLFGVGLNNFGQVSDRFTSVAAPFQILADQGIVGFSAYIYLFFALLTNLRKAKRRLGAENGLTALKRGLLIIFFYVIWADFFNLFFADAWFNMEKFIHFSIAALLVNKANPRWEGSD